MLNRHLKVLVKLSLNILMYLGTYKASAQIIQPCIFTRDTVGCAPFTIKMINCTNSKTGVLYNFIDNQIDNPKNYFFDTIHTYQLPGNYTIRQIITVSNSQGNFAIRQNYIRVKDKPVPKFNLIPCESKKVKIVILDTNYQQFTVDFGDGATVILQKSQSYVHQYATLGMKTVKVDALYVPGGCGTFTSKTVETFEKLTKPTIDLLQATLQPTDGNNLFISNLQDNSNYVINKALFPGLNYTPIDTLTGKSGNVNLFLKTDSKSKDITCFKLENIDGCGNRLVANETPCTINLYVAPENNAISLSWFTGIKDSVQKYEIVRNGVAIKVLSNEVANSFIDSSVQCGKSYCYQIIQFVNKNLIKSISLDTCILALSNKIPSGVLNSNATIQDNKIKLTWDANLESSVKEYSIYKSINSEPYNIINKQTSTTFFDTPAGFNAISHCYKINYVDSCGKNSLFSNIICPSILSFEIETGGSIKFDWTNYSSDYPLSSLNTYKLVRLDGQFKPNKEIYFGNNLTSSDMEKDTINQIKRYQIYVYSNAQVEPISYSNIVEINQGGTLYFPDAFTPNGDGINDIFVPKGRFIKNFKLGIYSRWGDLIFTSTELSKGWDGQGFPPGLYQYVVSFEDFLGNKKTQKGNITLLQ